MKTAKVAIPVALVVLFSFLSPAKGSSCGFTCYRQEQYSEGCGVWGWSRCNRYRSAGTTCYKNCPVNGGWSNWTPWREIAACSVTCHKGTRSLERTRVCNNPSPAYGGSYCSGVARETTTEACNDFPCPVIGGWSGWSLWRESVPCSVTCERGTRMLERTRACNNPAPMYGGKQCVGANKETQSEICNDFLCPVDGGWSKWTDWTADSTCSVTCGGGGQRTNVRRRGCAEPFPQFGGKFCEGEATQYAVEQCTSMECPSSPWSPWSDWSVAPCSVSCGTGTTQRKRTRHCTLPDQSARSVSRCEGLSEETSTFSCDTGLCSGPSEWGTWDDWQAVGECSALCGGGKVDMQRTRSCRSSLGRAQCMGDSMEIRQATDCNVQPCNALCLTSGPQSYPHPRNVSLYYRCQTGIPILERCPEGYGWDHNLARCAVAACQTELGLYQPSNSCATFVMCLFGRSVQMECPTGTVWDQSQVACITGQVLSCRSQQPASLSLLSTVPVMFG